MDTLLTRVMDPTVKAFILLFLILVLILFFRIFYWFLLLMVHSLRKILTVKLFDRLALKFHLKFMESVFET
jgi:hypothetical protein